jgi:hypothetical protein
MASGAAETPPSIGVAKIGMWQAVLVACISASAGIVSTLIVNKPAATRQAEPASVKSVPRYTQNVENYFGHTETEPYKWNGYKNDVSKLNAFVEEFLTSLPADYSDATSFYDAMDGAADTVHDRASKASSVGEQMVDYNWKVFAAPYLFRLELKKLRVAHRDGHLKTADEIQSFKSEFDTWLKDGSGEVF